MFADVSDSLKFGLLSESSNIATKDFHRYGQQNYAKEFTNKRLISCVKQAQVR